MDSKIIETPIIDVQTGSKLAVLAHGRLVPRPGCSLRECPTNLDLLSWSGRAMALAAGNPGTIILSDTGQTTVLATHFLIFPDSGADPETGEISEFARTILFTADGSTFRTTSAHAPNRIAAVLDLFGPDEWERGIPFIIEERRSKKTGRTYHDIRIAMTR